MITICLFGLCRQCVDWIKPSPLSTSGCPRMMKPQSTPCCTSTPGPKRILLRIWLNNRRGCRPMRADILELHRTRTTCRTFSVKDLKVSSGQSYCRSRIRSAQTLPALLTERNQYDSVRFYHQPHLQSPWKSADWKYQTSVCSAWSTVSCCLNVDMTLPLSQSRAGVENAHACLKVTRQTDSEREMF